MRESLRLRPDSASTWAQLGQVLATVGRKDEAVDAFRQALCICPDEAGAKEGLEGLDEPSNDQ